MIADNLSHNPGHSNKTLTSTWHFSQAMRMLHGNLSTTTEPQDSSIAVVISLAIHAKLRGATDESRIHLLGLKRIIELRHGGFAALRVHATDLGNKIRRADVELALLAGTSTVFGSQPLPETQYVFSLDDRGVFAMPYPFSEACSTVQCATHDILTLCSYAGCAHLDAFQYQDIVTSIFQRLVDYVPLGYARPQRMIDDTCQLGLIAFMTTILYRDNQKRLFYTVSLSKLLRRQMSRFDFNGAYEQEDQYPQLRLWLLFIYAFSTSEYDRCCGVNSAVAQDIRAVAKVLNLRRWEDALANVSVYPWIPAFHDESGKKLWDSANYGLGDIDSFVKSTNLS
jgi:hypothetical protein